MVLKRNKPKGGGKKKKAQTQAPPPPKETKVEQEPKKDADSDDETYGEYNSDEVRLPAHITVIPLNDLMHAQEDKPWLKAKQDRPPSPSPPFIISPDTQTAEDFDPDDPNLTTPMPRYNAMLAVLRNTLFMYAPVPPLLLPPLTSPDAQIRRHLRARLARVHAGRLLLAAARQAGPLRVPQGERRRHPRRRRREQQRGRQRREQRQLRER